MNRPRAMLAGSSLLVAAGLIAFRSPFQDANQPPTTRTVNCTVGGCHGADMDYPLLHAPAAAGACNVCHDYSNVERHEFVLKRTGGDLCNFCHIGKTDQAGVHVHEPVANEECLSCHNPHGSTQHRLMRGESEAAVCRSCHTEIGQDAHVHTPLTEGTCTDCHEAHISFHDKLLVAPGRSLCLTCHDTIDHPVQPAALPAGLGRSDYASEEMHPVHAPVLDDCAACHNPHSSDQASLLVQEPLKLCTTCHSEISSQATGATVPHSVVTDDRACLNCHNGHRSGVKSLLKDWPSELCMECHHEPVPRADGTMVAAALDLIEPHEFIHAPLADGTCSTCHDVHGGTHPNLLIGKYSTDFYNEYSNNAYQLCFLCHDQRLFVEPTTTETNFRNGNRNLHYVHVVAQEERGRGCRVCHATHTSPSPRHLRQETPFGQWNIPISFEVTDTGGGCAAGCHRSHSYDRENPVSYVTQASDVPPQDDGGQSSDPPN